MVYVVFTNFPECHCMLNSELLTVCKLSLQCLSDSTCVAVLDRCHTCDFIARFRATVVANCDFVA